MTGRILDKFKLDNKKAIVTGGARGLGNGIAKGLYEAGAQVSLIDILPEVYQAAKNIDEKNVFALQADLQGRQQIREGFEKAIDILKDVDILVTAAGIQYRSSAIEFPEEQWERILRINLSSVFYICQCAAEYMIKKKSGHIINVASMLSFFGGIMIPAYAASKGGIAQLTKALSNEWSEYGVFVNAIAPGYMETELTVTMRKYPDQVKNITSRIPMGRWGTQDDVKGLCVFLASEASSYITGSIIAVDGGYKCR